MARMSHKELSDLTSLRAHYNAFMVSYAPFKTTDGMEALSAALTNFLPSLPSSEQSILKYTELLNEISNPKGAIYQLICSLPNKQLQTSADAIWKLPQMQGLSTLHHPDTDRLAAALTAKKEAETALEEKARTLAESKVKADELEATVSALKEAAAQAQLIDHVAQDTAQLLNIAQKISLAKVEAKVLFVREGLEYLKKIANSELTSQKYILSISEYKGFAGTGKSLNTTLQDITFTDFAVSACESTKNPEMVDLELNQAIGWLEYIPLKEAYHGDTEQILKAINSHITGETKLATAIAHIEDILKSNEKNYDNIHVKVTCKKSGIFGFGGVDAKEETLSEFIKANLIHAVEDMYLHKTDEGLQYMSHCIEAINDSVSKAGIVIDMHSLVH